MNLNWVTYVILTCPPRFLAAAEIHWHTCVNTPIQETPSPSEPQQGTGGNCNARSMGGACGPDSVNFVDREVWSAYTASSEWLR